MCLGVFHARRPETKRDISERAMCGKLFNILYVSLPLVTYIEYTYSILRVLRLPVGKLETRFFK